MRIEKPADCWYVFLERPDRESIATLGPRAYGPVSTLAVSAHLDERLYGIRQARARARK